MSQPVLSCCSCDSCKHVYKSVEDGEHLHGKHSNCTSSTLPLQKWHCGYCTQPVDVTIANDGDDQVMIMHSHWDSTCGGQNDVSEIETDRDTDADSDPDSDPESKSDPESDSGTEYVDLASDIEDEDRHHARFTVWV